MDNYMNIGEVIRAARKEKHMSQTELATGICSKDYIYAIENSKNNPSGYILEQLSRKLGFDLYDYYKAVYRHISWETHIHILNLNEYALIKDLTKLKEEISTCEQIPEFQTGEPRQILLFAQSIIESEGNHNIRLAIDLCREALKVFKPDFQTDSLDQYNFSVAEMVILSQFAFNSRRIDHNQEASTIYFYIYSKLDYLLTLKIFDLNINRNSDRNIFLISCLNLATLEIEKHNPEQARIYIENGLLISERAHDSTWLPSFLLCRCHLYCSLGLYDRAAIYYYDAKTLSKYSGHSKDIEMQFADILSYYPQLNQKLQEFSCPLANPFTDEPENSPR